MDLLRGVAAVSVCFFHFAKGYMPEDHFFRLTTSYGHLGVQVFFVISGFIIPFAMHKGKYTLARFRNFFAKRLLRIEPPYLISIGVIVILNFGSTLSPYYQGEPFILDTTSLLLHFGYLNSFFNHNWLNPVYWTLAIEFQYYILIALIFPLLIQRSYLYWLLPLIIFNLLGIVIPGEEFIFHFALYFTMGIFSFRYYVDLDGKITFLFFALLNISIIYWFSGLPSAIACLLPALFIFGPQVENKVSSFLGQISYSLYLLHVPIGGRIINFSKNFVSDPNQKIVVVFLALLTSVICAYLSFRVIEYPFQKLSRKIKYAIEPKYIEHPVPAQSSMASKSYK